mgnify:CR=1 FL=1
MKVNETIAQIFANLQQGEIGPVALDLLLPDGKPHSFENTLWDYKRKAPTLAENPNKEDRELYTHEIHELIKDIVSFHNSYGGYLVFGVEDKGGDRVIGCDVELDLGDLSKRIRSQTGADIELFQATLPVDNCNLLLLLIPRRRSAIQPVKFGKAAPLHGKDRAYAKGSIYVRIQDECRPANASADDWQFLFSERKLSSNAPPEKVDNIPSNLPPRDPDMIEFVGREKELSELRSWVLDARNPTRLISGIGGLGKTSVAYKFSEELSATGAGDFDFIAWVSAKKSTFAALRGEMVKTTRHDFSTIEQLLRRLTIIVAGESSVSSDMDQDEYIEVLADALIYRPSFIVVDDLDSLPPEDQRECASILQEVAFRTVDRNYRASKILLTSRLDQSLSPTSVIKISGLELAEFTTLIRNLCRQFDLNEFRPGLVKEIHKSASGSPLFASAIVRLSSLGENPSEICKTWASKEGEDVREFAFKRELDRLTPISASILLAVVKLGEVSTEEILEVVEISRRSLLDRINELQSFHLLSKTENRQGDLVFSTSKELVSASGILRKRLGAKSQEVERRCAIIRKNQGNQTKEVGRRIREIVVHWDENQYDEALVKAKSLVARNPKNGDAWCALAKAHLKIKPQQFSAADKAATQAVSFSCDRPELFDVYVMAKQGVEDWQGLKSYAETKRFKATHKDPALDAYIVATGRLENLASARGNLPAASKYALETVKKISAKISSTRLEKPFFERIAKDKNRLAKQAIYHQRRSLQTGRDHLKLSDLGFQLIDLDVTIREVFEAICEGLRNWADAIKGASFADDAALDILSKNTEKLERLKIVLSRCSRDTGRDLLMIEKTQKHLGFVGASF